MKDKKLQDTDGSVPKHVINQIVEHTAGGFVLFYFNSIDGAPGEIITCDSPAHCLALQKHIADWTYALQDLHVENEKIHIRMVARQEAEQEGDDGEGENKA